MVGGGGSVGFGQVVTWSVRLVGYNNFQCHVSGRISPEKCTANLAVCELLALSGIGSMKGELLGLIGLNAASGVGKGVSGGVGVVFLKIG